MNTAKKVLFYSRDPGGTNCIIPVYQQLREMKDVETVLWGKDFAIRKYQEEGLEYRDIGNLKKGEVRDILSQLNPNILVTGTSYGDRTEQWLWKTAGKLGIYSIAILDQWLCYRIRFSDSSGRLTMPDKILVMDEMAKKEMVADGFDGQKILATGQPHFEMLREKAGKISESDKRKIKEDFNCRDGFVILFASEPFSVASHVDLGFTENAILQEIVFAIQQLERSVKINLLVKLHPKQSRDKVQRFIQSLPVLNNLRILIVTDYPVLPLILVADIVIGIQSTVLIEANILDKPVMSVQIGRKGPDQFILSKRGVIEAVTTSDVLSKGLKRFFLRSGKTSQKMFPVLSHPVENIKRFIMSVSDQQ
ncbi:MAG: polysialyltransferase family glycosyltransferase [Nitrospirota bacterium]